MREIIAGAIQFVILAAVMFAAAGTVDWPRGWTLLAVLAIVSIASAVWLWRFDKGLYAERAASPFARTQRPRDRGILLAIVAMTLAWVVFMPLDAVRFHWSRAPTWTAWLGGALIVATFAGILRVFRENRFASVQVKLQAERGQRVIDTGPYRFVRHPMYAAATGLLLGWPLMLGSWWGLAFTPPMMALYGWRAVAEEDLLRRELAGYEAYTRSVRWRLIPGIW